jgi:hypothetical protein
MGHRYAAAAIGALLTNRPRVLERLAARRPEALAAAWKDLLLVLGAVAGLETERFLVALVPLLPNLSLDDPLDADGNRLVHWAAMYGRAADLAPFARFGADLRVPNRLGTTPLFDAVRGGCAATVEVIVRHVGRGILEHVSGYDCTAMHWACKHASLPGAAALHRLDSGLLNRPNRRGCLPLDVLEWRELYHADLARRTLGRPPTPEELWAAAEFIRGEQAYALADGAKPALSPWEKYAQVLLMSDEFMFID